MKIKSILLVSLLAFTFVLGFQNAQAQGSVGNDQAAVTATVNGSIPGEQVDVYVGTPDGPFDPTSPTTIPFGIIDASTADYHLAPQGAINNATLSWAALPGAWQLRVYYDTADDQVKGTDASNLGAPLSVAIGWELDPDAAGFVNPGDLHPDPDPVPEDSGQPYYGDQSGTYRVIRVKTDLVPLGDEPENADASRLADGVSLTDAGERKFDDIGDRPFVLASRTLGGAFNGAYSGIITFDLDEGL